MASRSLTSTLRKIRGKSSNQLARYLWLRIWPFRPVGRAYHWLRSREAVYRLINREARLGFECRNVLPHRDQLHAVDSLATNGIFLSTVEDVTADRALYGLLEDEAKRMIASPYMAKQIGRGQDALGLKQYVIRGLGRRNHQALPDSFAALFLNNRLLEIINAYLGLQCRLNYVDLWYNVPVQKQEPSVSSEFWHRDHEDRHVIKVFTFLTDIDENMGPFTYLEGTQYGGKYSGIFPAKPAQGAYPEPNALVEEVQTLGIPIHRCIGPTGSLVVADTSGIHKGGRTESRPRIILVGFYTSNSGLDPLSYRLPEGYPSNSLSPIQRYALRLPSD